MSGCWQEIADAPLMVSGFRPFYLLGACYAPLLVIGSAALGGTVALESAGGPVLWHAHEMLFGFAMAIVVGTLLTALPSWAGTPELRGAPLAWIVAAWLLGRVALWAVPWLAPPLVALADMLLWPALLGLIAPAVWRVPNHLYRLLLPILLALALANLAYHVALMTGDASLAQRALRGAVWALLILYTLKGGLLTPIFTGNALRALGRGQQARFLMPLEALALALLIALALADLAGAARSVTGLLAGICAALHAARMARWRGWLVADQPLLPAMHLGFAWLLLALVLKSLADLFDLVPPTAWLHAFTVGALGLMMLSLMTRVSLRHTGRALTAVPVMRVATAVMFGAATLRVWTSVRGLELDLVALASALWAAAFLAYVLRFGAVLLTPSRPRSLPPDGQRNAANPASPGPDKHAGTTDPYQ